MIRETFNKIRIRKENNLDKNRKNKLHNKEEKVNREDFQYGCCRSRRVHRARMGVKPGVGQFEMSFQDVPARIHNHRRRYLHRRYGYGFLQRQGLSIRGHNRHFEKQSGLHRRYKTSRRYAKRSLFQEQKYLRNLIHLLIKRLDRVSYLLNRGGGGRGLPRFEGRIS